MEGDQASSAFHDRKAPWLTENSPEEEDAASMVKIEVSQKLSDRGSLVRSLLGQCMYGADHTKRTEFRGSAPILFLKSARSHQSRWWRVPSTGRWHFAPHPPVVAGDDRLFVGGLRRTASAVAALPSVRRIGRQARACLTTVIDSDPNIMRNCLDAIGSPVDDAGPTAEQLDRARPALGNLLGTRGVGPLDPAKHCRCLWGG